MSINETAPTSGAMLWTGRIMSALVILFLIFDIESAFLYPWAALYRKLSCLGTVAGTQCLGTVTVFGFVEMLVFIGTLVVALAYVWRKRAIGWG